MSLHTEDRLSFRHGDRGEHLHRVAEITGIDDGSGQITYRIRVEDLEEPADLYEALVRLQNEVYANARDKAQYNLGLNQEERANEFPKALANIMAELGEAMDDWRSGKPVNLLDFEDDGKPVGIPSELADVIIWVLSQCGYHNVDLAKAVQVKVAYNKTRPSKHGRGRT